MARAFVLVVEDNPDDEALTIRALKKNNLANDVVVARDGVEALDFLFGEGAFAGRDVDEQPAVILLDLNLPKISGLDVLKRIREDPRTRYLPVVVLTSSDEEGDLVESYERGCNSYVRKPVEFSEFTKAIHELGLYWVLVNKSPPSGT